MGGFNINAFISQQEQLKQIELDLLIPYHNHKFKLYDGERLNDMVQSIKDNGVLTPIIVRSAPDNSGKYEILAGHNRCNAAHLAGLTAVPGVIKGQLSDEEAEMYVIETNLMQRGFNDLRITEQAAVVAIRHSQMFTESKRAEIESEIASLQEIGSSKLSLTGDEYGLSKNSVARLIRIDKLVPELKPYVDDKTIAVRAGVELSYLFVSEQRAVARLVSTNGMNTQTAELLRDVSSRNQLNNDTVREIMTGFYKSKSDSVTDIKEKPIKITIQPSTFRKYFNEDTKASDVEDIVSKALEMYFFSVNK